MDSHPFSTLSAFLIVAMTFLCPSKVVAADNWRYRNCSATFDCGNITDIGYPFWGSNRPDYCGHPDFRLNCTDRTAVITIDNLTYQVLEMDKESKYLRVARTDYVGGICPNLLHNTTFNSDFFRPPATGNRNITLFYGCRTNTITPSPQPGLNEFTCSLNGSDSRGFYVTTSVDKVGNSILSAIVTCNNSVNVQAIESAVRTVDTSSTEENLKIALEQGFGLQWNTGTVNDNICQTCNFSRGQCGYNTTTSSFSCYCADGAQPFSCGESNQPESGGSKSNKVPLGVGLGIAGGAAGVALGFWFLLKTQKRKRIGAQTQSKDLPTPPPPPPLLPPLSKGQSDPTTNRYKTRPSYPSSKSDLENGSNYFGAKVFSYEELVEATNNFDRSRELGDGGFGTVYYGVLNDGRVVAVKRLYENNMRRTEQFTNEIEILTQLQHKNLVTLYGCTSKRTRDLILVYEYVPNGTVADHLHGNRSKSGLLTWPVRLSIAIESAEALAYLHASDVIHRDVKTNNILLDNNFRVKVADFGLSRLFPNDVTHVSTAPQGTPGYVDPEYYQCYHLTDKSDVYSFGVVLIELISSLQAVDTNRNRLDINLANMAVNKIQNHSLNELVDPCLGFEKDDSVRKMATSVAELAFRCLQQERDMRPTMAEVLNCLKIIENENYGLEKPLIVDIINIKEDGEVLNKAPQFSPDSIATSKWVSSSTATTTTTDDDDAGLLNQPPPLFSTDSIKTDKWGKVVRTM